MNTAKTRDSQFELLRIVAIFFVIVHHLVIKGADTVGYISAYSLEQHGIAGVFINSFVVVGVNLFVLISGWYGVKLRIKSIVRLIVDCVVFGIISYIILLILSDHEFHVKELIVSSFFTKNWFVVSYMMLLLSAPIMEVSIENTNKKTLLVWLALLTILNLYFGYYLKQVNTNGYNYIQFVWLYYIARFLKISQNEKWYQRVIRYSMVSYVFFSLLLAALFILCSFMGIVPNSLRWFAYNNPLLMFSSISLFIWFSSKSFMSKHVNWFATGVFGVFLLHTTPFMIPFRNRFTQGIFEGFGYFGILVEALIILIVGGIICVYINKLSVRVTSFVSSKLEIGFQAVGRKAILFNK